LNLRGFPAIFPVVIRQQFSPSARAQKHPGRGRFLTLGSALLVVFSAACKENLSPPPIITGPDSTGPRVQLRPGKDTLVDSTGILLVAVNAEDPSGIKSVDMQILPATFGFPVQSPLDTTFGAFYSVPLGAHKHSVFRYFVRATDILDHETVTDTVTVTVK
jgi:hypothetical protein